MAPGAAINTLEKPIIGIKPIMGNNQPASPLPIGDENCMNVLNIANVLPRIWSGIILIRNV